MVTSTIHSEKVGLHCFPIVSGGEEAAVLLRHERQDGRGRQRKEAKTRPRRCKDANRKDSVIFQISNGKRIVYGSYYFKG